MARTPIVTARSREMRPSVRFRQGGSRSTRSHPARWTPELCSALKTLVGAPGIEPREVGAESKPFRSERKRMGIEPTKRVFGRFTSFEDWGDHQISKRFRSFGRERNRPDFENSSLFAVPLAYDAWLARIRFPSFFGIVK